MATRNLNRDDNTYDFIDKAIKKFDHGGENTAVVPSSCHDFIFKYARTYDPHWEYKGMEMESNPFPAPSYIDSVTGEEKPHYLKIICDVWDRDKLILVPKSRQLMVSWIFCALNLHLAISKSTQAIFFVSRKLENAGLDNQLSLLSRAKFIFDHLPEEMQPEMEVTKQPPILKFPENGSFIQGCSQDSEALRSYTASSMLCINPATRVLTDKLKWVLADNVKIDDKLAGFDEKAGVSGKRADGSKHVRRWRKAVVTNIHRHIRPCYKLTFSDGTEVTCSKDHKWLIGYSQRLKWCTTKNVRAVSGGRAGSKFLKLANVWEEDRDYEAGYLAGAFDGEGCFRQIPYDRPGFANSSSTAISVSQNENAMLDKMRTILREKGFKFYERVIYHDRYSTPHHVFNMGKRAHIMEFLGRIRPQRLLDKLDLDRWGMMVPLGGVELVEKEDVGDQEVISIATTSKTFIAEGLASHNCDEWAFQENADESYAALKPTLQGGGRLQGVSTPNGKRNLFYRLVHDVSASDEI